MWDKLAERIAKRIQANQPERWAIEDEIKKFVDETVIQCYFKCDTETAKKAKRSE
jgi:hypothetical protein